MIKILSIDEIKETLNKISDTEQKLKYAQSPDYVVSLIVNVGSMGLAEDQIEEHLIWYPGGGILSILPPLNKEIIVDEVKNYIEESKIAGRKTAISSLLSRLAKYYE